MMIWDEMDDWAGVLLAMLFTRPLAASYVAGHSSRNGWTGSLT